MPGPYFQKESWPSFSYRGNDYAIGHLDEYELEVTDSEGRSRLIAVTFGDHCFTRPPAPDDDPALVYPASDRRPGHFCFVRYQHSFGLPSHIAVAAKGKVWTVGGDNYAAIPTVSHEGQPVFYGVVFSLDKVSGLPVHLHMRVKSAYIAEAESPVTYGSVRFAHLVALRTRNKRPGRITDRNRRVPRLP